MNRQNGIKGKNKDWFIDKQRKLGQSQKCTYKNLSPNEKLQKHSLNCFANFIFSFINILWQCIYYVWLRILSDLERKFFTIDFFMFWFSIKIFLEGWSKPLKFLSDRKIISQYFWFDHKFFHNKSKFKYCCKMVA